MTQPQIIAEIKKYQ